MSKAHSDELLAADSHSHDDDEDEAAMHHIDLNGPDNVMPDIEMHSSEPTIATSAPSSLQGNKQSKLASITNKFRDSKIKKSGFSKIDDNDDSDHENAHELVPVAVPRIPSASFFQVTLGKQTCRCTKRKTIIAVVGFILCFIIVVMIVAASNMHSSSTSSSSADIDDNCMHGRQVLIISMDGFRASYLDTIPVPNIKQWFQEEGVYVEAMQPVYPSKTFPNHYSIVTGLYPPSHGIVANHFWDPVLNKSFDIQTEGDDASGIWFHGEPIWNTIKQKNLSTASLSWPGSAAFGHGRVINGSDLSGYAAFYTLYDPDWPVEARINLTVELLLNEEGTAHYDLAMLYLEHVDQTGHLYGPESPQMSDAVQQMDAYIGALMRKMEQHALLDTTDIILLSDHGMTSVELYNESTYMDADSKIIVIDPELFDFDSVIIRDWWPVMAVYLNSSSSSSFPDGVTQAMDAMQNAIVHNAEHAHFYQNGFIPYTSFNDVHSYNHRVADFIVDIDLGYAIYVQNKSVPNMHGTHGYNNSETDMQAVFMARGPSFQSSKKVDGRIQNIHLYNLFCRLLCDVQPNPNNGTSEIYDQQLLAEDHAYW